MPARRVAVIAPGLALAALLALAAMFISGHYGGPVMLLALLLGMPLNFLADSPRLAPGIAFASRFVLRLGVGLLGLRITFEQVAELGWGPVLLVVAAVVFTLLAGLALARMLGMPRFLGALTGGAVGICGASAAMAISAVLPQRPELERYTAFTVVGVTVLSTVAMVLYPLLVVLLGFDHAEAGLFLGATIHDVAQVVGAGYIVSEQTGDLATFTKLLRVAMLLPVVMIIAWAVGRQVQGGTAVKSALPWFLLLFVALVIVNSLGWVPVPARDVLVSVSLACLVTAIAALGVKTSLRDLASVGPRAATLIVAETVLLAVVIAAALLLF
ncbi:MAG: putative sulfate exporter family transporter [Gammaproteobacteria bacterium]|nr:putative sulfate exporter family transporter [Gammaproteobacteria bacterium]